MSKRVRKRGKSAPISSSSRVAARMLGGLIMISIMGIAVFVGYNLGIKKHDAGADAHYVAPSEAQPSAEADDERARAQRKAKYSFYDELKKRSGEVQAEVESKSKELAAVPVGKGVYYRVQVGAFKEKEQAERLRARLILRDYPVTIVQSNSFHLVQVGPYQQREEAKKIESNLKKSGFNVLLKKFESH